MKSLNHQRASAAERFWHDLGRHAPRGEQIEASLRKLCAAIHRRGLLSVTASLHEIRRNGGGSQSTFEEVLLLEIGRHLISREIGLLSFPVRSLEDLLRGLTAGSSVMLLPATIESLNYLGFLKRACPR